MIGLPLDKTTIVGTPVLAMALIRGPWAPTRDRSSASTCSPVLVLSVFVALVVEILVSSRCVQSLPELSLVAGPGSNDYDGYVGFLCCFDCCVEA